MKRKLQNKRMIDKMNCLLALWMLLPAYRNVKINPGEQYAIFSDKLQRMLKLKMGISNGNRFFISVLQICQSKIKLKLNLH